MLKSFIQKFLSNNISVIYLCSGGLVLGTALLGLFISSVSIPVPVIWHVLLERMFGFVWLEDIQANISLIIWEIRVPRVLLALTVGMSLSLAGAAFQGLLRNPLADPYTLGVSSGAALGAVTVLFFKISIIGLASYTLPFFAILGGALALLLVYGMTQLASRSFAIETMILAGIIISSFIGSLISLIIALSGEELRQILYWLMGSVAMRGWSHFYLLFPFLLVGAAMILTQHRELNALALGETSAQHLGVHVKRKKAFILIGASLLTGACVAVSGTIGFVGLVIPHLVRLVIGPNHKHLLPLSMLVGGAFLMGADVLARTVIAPKELPIGVITALVGAPVFALLLIKEKLGRGFRG